LKIEMFYRQQYCVSIMKIKITCFLFAFYIFFANELSAQFINNHKTIFQGELGLQPKGKIFKDPKFNTDVMRITDARSERLPGIVPQYSKRQAWNSDETLLLLQACDGRIMLFDGNYIFLRFLEGVYGEDIFWHPQEPNTIIFCPDSVLYSYNVQSDEVKTLHVFSDYTFANTRAEGNLSNDGRYWAFVGQTYDSENGTRFKDIVVYDLVEDRVVSKMPLPSNLTEFDWVSISPRGDYVVIDYATMGTGRYEGVEVYDRNLNFIWQKPLGAGHSDLGIDENGDEVLVIGYYDADSNETFIKKFCLSDGKETVLLKHHWSFYNHISCRNIKRNGWCFVSTYDGEARLTDDSLSWQPFEDEIFALKLDGTGDVQRLCHHRSRRFSPTTPDSDNSVYYAEPHATVSPSGTRILFGSNWRQNIEQDTSCDAYVVDFRNWLGLFQKDDRAMRTELHYRDGIVCIRLSNEISIESIEIYNSLLKRVAVHSVEANLRTGESILMSANLSCGFYFVKLNAGENTIMLRLLVWE